jgi:oligopeptidase A
MTNPLLDTSSLPRFGDIKPEHVLPAIQQVIAGNRARLNDLLGSDNVPDIDAVVAPVEHMEHELSRIWSPVSHLQSVLGSKDWREAYKQALPLLTEYGTEISQNADLQRAYAEVSKNLPDDASEASRSAVDHVGDDNLRGLPEAVLARAAEDAKKASLSGWLLSLDHPTYDAVLKHADSRDLREAMYRGWVTRASDQGKDSKWDNSENIEKVLALRHEAANLIGFKSYAEYSLATKMADTPEQVLGFLRKLSGHSRAAAEKELEELTEFAGMHLEAWDITYWLEKYKQDKYSVSNEELRAYFPATTVKDGLFALASQLYGVELQQDENVTTWHEDVRYYNVRQSGAVLGGFYTDLFARNGKRTGAWIDECVSRQQLNGHFAFPVGYLVCNFQRPDDRGLSLLTHDDVVTLFHEFGHMLHHLLTQVDFPSVSGINGVPWDAVELPSQFMENFAWNYDVLTRCSSHHQFNKPLPRDLFDKLINSRHAGAALAMLRQLELGLFDFRVHTEYDPDAPVPVLETLAEVRDEVALIRHPDINRLPHAFSHIFAGGYAAGYYSYKWAEVLAADAFSAFEDAGIFDEATARRFRREILEVGGSRDIMQAYIAFRGREPTIDALLRQTGIEV